MSIETQISQVLETVGESKQEMVKILQFSNENDVPLALKNLVKEIFSCKICHQAPFAPPIVYQPVVVPLLAVKVVSKVGMEQAVMSLTKHAHCAELNVDIHIHSDYVEWMTFR